MTQSLSFLGSIVIKQEYYLAGNKVIIGKSSIRKGGSEKN